MIERRRFLQLTGGLSAAAVASSVLPGLARASSWKEIAKRARDAGEDRVIVAGPTGKYLKNLNDHFLETFTKETGIAVDIVGGSNAERVAKLIAQHKVGQTEWDIILGGAGQPDTPDVVPIIKELDGCSEMPNVVSNGTQGTCLARGIFFDLGGLVLSYDGRAFPNGGPTSWAEFYDVEKFPGPRALPDYGRPWQVLATALMADGVPIDELFPMDLDRAYAKLDSIKPNIAAWWTSGDNSQQLYRSEEVVMSMMFSNRAEALRAEGLPINYSWKGSLFDPTILSILKNAPHPNAALSLVDFFFTRPDVHADYIAVQFLTTPIKGLASHMDAAVADNLVTKPENWSQLVYMDQGWVSENKPALVERWTSWISD